MIPAYIAAENVVSFTQEDENSYCLRVFVDELDTENEQGHVDIWMGTFEAVRLLSLARKLIGPYVEEMELARASYRRGEGPHGEPAGTWETDTQALHGYRCCDPEGSWVEDQRYAADLARKAERENR